MDFVKVTTSGQVSIPKKIRSQLSTNLFYCELTPEGVLFRPSNHELKKIKKNIAFKDLPQFTFKGKNPKETNLASHIDEIVYL